MRQVFLSCGEFFFLSFFLSLFCFLFRRIGVVGFLWVIPGCAKEKGEGRRKVKWMVGWLVNPRSSPDDMGKFLLPRAKRFFGFDGVGIS